jgi:hypothetical protein
MTEPSPARPIPGPPSPGPSSRPWSGLEVEPAPEAAAAGPRAETASFDGLTELPVAEHVAVFEAEHARLQRELSTIDQL